MTSPEFPQSLKPILEPAADRWHDSEGLEESTLLRLAVLRDLVRQIHSAKSKALARGAKDEAETYRYWERRIEELRSSAALSGSLDEVLRSTQPIRKRTRLLPDSLFSFIEKEKLERYDRSWEAILAAEAISLGWRFWALDAWVKIPQAEEFHKALGTQLIPHGVLLFAESAEDGAVTETAWHGRWVVILKPRFLTPDFRVSELPGLVSGVTQDTPSANWKLLFSPKKR